MQCKLCGLITCQRDKMATHLRLPTPTDWGSRSQYVDHLLLQGPVVILVMEAHPLENAVPGRLLVVEVLFIVVVTVWPVSYFILYKFVIFILIYVIV